MAKELTQIKTLSLRDYLDEEITKLHQECMELFDGEIDNLSGIQSNCARLVALQEITYRLEYGFITEIGNKSLKHHLART